MKKSHLFALAAFILSGNSSQVAAQSLSFELPDYYIEGSAQVAVTRMIAVICPQIEVRERLVDLYLIPLSEKLKKEMVLPDNVKEDSHIFKFKVLTDDRFVELAAGIFKKYDIDPFKNADPTKPEVYERYCAMGIGEIEEQSNIGKFLELSAQ